MVDAKNPFLAFALTSVGTRNWSDSLFSSARSKSRVFWAKDAFEASGFSLDWCCPRNLHNLLAGIRLISWRLGDFIQQFQSDRFINGMSLALCLFYLLFPTVFGDDMARRGFLSTPTVLGNSAGAPAWSVCYLCWRPSSGKLLVK